MNVLTNYSEKLQGRGLAFELIKFIPYKKVWKYKLLCKRPIGSAEKIDTLLKELYHLVGDLVMDGYDVKIIDEFNLLIKKS